MKKWSLAWILAVCALQPILPIQAHEERGAWLSSSLPSKKDNYQLITSRSVELTEAEKEAGVSGFSDLLPTLEQVNQRYHIYSPKEYQQFVQNFHYPYRERFFIQDQAPPTHVVLHWTANKRTDIPLYTLSAFLRRRQRGRVVERPHQYKNVSNYFLTGSLAQPGQEEQASEARLVKLTRGDISSWGDIPRVTAYPTGDQWDDNKYDARGAIGIEIESPNFGSFYNNQSQRDKLHNFLILVLKERGVLQEFAALRDSAEWENLLKLQAYLKNNLAKVDVQANGGIAQHWQLLDKIAQNLAEITPETVQSAKQIFSYISGHGVVAHEYNARMIRAKRPRDADYDKIDFTEPHVFLVAMDLLQNGLSYRGNNGYAGYDLAIQRLIDQQKQTTQYPPHSVEVGTAETPGFIQELFPIQRKEGKIYEAR
jgi:hypothetical protein